MPLSILVVEDDADLRELLAGLLAEEGHEVRTAENGAAAFVQLYLGAPPDLMVLDLWMPVVTGPEVLEVLRQDPRLSSIPVIVVSGAPVPEAVRRDATCVLAKPFAADDLLATIALALRGPPGPPTTQLS